MCVCRCNAHRVRRIRSIHRPPKVREWAETRCRVKTSLLEPGGFPETPISGGARLSRSEPSRQKPRPRPPEGGRGTPGPRRGPDREGENIFKETRLSAHTQTMSLHWRDRVKAWDCIWPGQGTAYGSRLISYGMLLSPPHLRQALILLHACAQPRQQLHLLVPSPRPFLSFSEYGARELVYLHMHHTCTAHDRRGRTRTSDARAELRAHLNWCHRGQ